MLKTFELNSKKRVEMIDITYEVKKVVNDHGIKYGIVLIYTPHTTAGITINENADSDVQQDIISEINKIISATGDYLHFEGNSDSHIKSSLFGVSEQVIINQGNLLLGQWQGIYFCEFDGPRTRKIYIKVIAG